MNNLIVKYEQQIILALLFFIALAFRLFNIDFSFSNDELSAIIRCNQDSYSNLIVNGIKTDGHPAGIQTLMYYWIKTFGNTEFIVRLPFAIFGSLAVVFSYLYTYRKFGKTPALLTATAIMLLEFPLLHSQIARPYSSGLMLSMLLILFWDKVVFPNENDKKNNIRNLIILSLIYVANAYNHYFSSLFAAIVFISGLAVISRKNLIKYISSGIIAFILFVPHLSITITHLSIGGVGLWLGKPKTDFIYTHILHIFNDSLALTLIIINALMLYLIVNKTSIFGKWKTRIFMLFLFLLPFSIAYFYSIYVNPVLQNRVLIFSMPFFLIFAFSFFNETKTLKLKMIVLTIPIAIFIHTIFISNYYSKQHFINFKGIANICANTHQTFDNKDILSIQHCNSKSYLQYYLQDNSINFNINEITTDDDLLKLREILDANTDKKYLEYVSTKPQNRIATMMITSLYDNINILDSNLYNNGYHLFEKAKKLNKIKQENTIKYFDYSNDTFNLEGLEYSKGIAVKIDRKINLVLKLRLKFRQEKEGEVMIAYEKKNINKEEDKIWWSAPLKFFKSNEWNRISFDYPIEANKNDEIKLYIWNPKKEAVDIIEYEIGIFERK